MSKYPIVYVYGAQDSDINEDIKKQVTLVTYKDDNDVLKQIATQTPNVIITVGQTWHLFPKIASLPYSMRSRWVHYKNAKQIIYQNVMLCYMSSLKGEDTNNPLVTVFTATYNSRHKIMRPFNSLRNQTYKNWEWVIIDDSNDDGKTFDTLKKLKNREYRMRIFRADGNSGVIGEVKYNAASLGRGSILVEIDHDDELTDDCLQNIVYAFKQRPDVGFVYTDFAEVYEKENKTFQYGPHWGYGYGAYYAQYHKGTLVYVATSLNVNPKTIRNIIGAPNHVRAWRTSVYREIGGHSNLPVGDDYELLIRTFLKTRMLRIPKLGYLQYRNEDGNTTFSRNAEIQKIQKIASSYYENQIHQRFVELGITDDAKLVIEPYMQYWRRPTDYHEQHATVYLPRPDDVVSVIIPTYKRPTELGKALKSVFAQTYQKFEILIVGDKCPELDKFMTSRWNDPRIRWWNLAENSNDSGATPRNYALRKLVRTDLVAYLDDDNLWEPNHLETLVKALKDNNTDYAFSSFVLEDVNDDLSRREIAKIICKEPKLYRIDTSAILHKYELIEKYGYWMSGKTRYSHDWELVSRWAKHPWVATELATVRYTVDFNRCNPKSLYEYYRDQDPVFLNQKTNVDVQIVDVNADSTETTQD